MKEHNRPALYLVLYCDLGSDVRHYPHVWEDWSWIFNKQKWYYCPGLLAK